MLPAALRMILAVFLQVGKSLEASKPGEPKQRQQVYGCQLS